jgi:hypothetical protein
MSRLLRVLFTSLLLVLLWAVAGCGGQTAADKPATPEATATSQAADQADEARSRLIAEWDLLVAQTQALLDENDALETQMGDALDKVNAIDFAGGNAADAPPILADVRADLGQLKKNSESIMVLWDKASELDVGEEYTTYAGQQKEIEGLQIKMYAVANDLIAKLAYMFGQIGKATPAEIDKLNGELSGVMAKGDKLQSRIDEKKQESEKYANDNIAAE